jgi:hypothetical protein
MTGEQLLDTKKYPRRSRGAEAAYRRAALLAPPTTRWCRTPRRRYHDRTWTASLGSNPRGPAEPLLSPGSSERELSSRSAQERLGAQTIQKRFSHLLTAYRHSFSVHTISSSHRTPLHSRVCRDEVSVLESREKKSSKTSRKNKRRRDQEFGARVRIHAQIP